MMRFVRAAVIATAALLACTPIASAADPQEVGVVFMHGKWGTSGAKSPIAELLLAIRASGFKLQAPDMPWSRDRAYDRDVDGALAEIDTAVKSLRDDGATRIVVGGQSTGANVALIYGSRRDGLAGIMAISPGHTPEFGAFRQTVASDVARAKSMVESGRGNEKATFLDINQGQQKKLTLPASIYWSWMNPDGAAVMPKSAAALKPGLPLLWVTGVNDPLEKQGQSYAFAKAPPNPKSSYIVTQGGHFDANEQAAPQIIAWLKAL